MERKGQIYAWIGVEMNTYEKVWWGGTKIDEEMNWFCLSERARKNKQIYSAQMSLWLYIKVTEQIVFKNSIFTLKNVWKNEQIQTNGHYLYHSDWH